MPTWTVLELLRKDPEAYRAVFKKRGMNESLLEEALKLDSLYLSKLKEIEALRSEHNKYSKLVREAKSQEEKTKYISIVRELASRIDEEEKKFQEIKNAWENVLKKLPNILADDVPVGFSDEENVPVRGWGKAKVPSSKLKEFYEQTEKCGVRLDYEVIEKEPVPHADMLEYVLGMGDTQQAGKIASSRFYYLFDDLVWLDFALSLLALDTLARKGYRLVIPPYMIRTKVLESALDYDTFKDMIYKIEGEDLNLIGTAEHPILALLYDNPVREEDLPIKLAGWSACFRKEAGAGNRDLKGIFRVHQFHKVEQFVFAHPSDSWGFLEEMTRNTEEILQALELPYRVVKVVSGEIGLGVAKKYDVEVWYPSQGKFREIASISHLIDWQAFRGNLTFIRKSDGRREYVHTLNGTGLPTTRAITAILENHQQSDGAVYIPKALRKYLESIPSAPKDYIHPRKKSAFP